MPTLPSFYAAALAVNARRKGRTLAQEVQNRDLDMNPEAFVIAQFMARTSAAPGALPLVCATLPSARWSKCASPSKTPCKAACLATSPR